MTVWRRGARDRERGAAPVENARADDNVSDAVARLASAVEAQLRDAPLALPTDRLWTVEMTAAYLHVSERYLRESSCPRVLLPGNGTAGTPLVRFDPAEVKDWEQQWHTAREARDAQRRTS